MTVPPRAEKPASTPGPSEGVDVRAILPPVYPLCLALIGTSILLRLRYYQRLHWFTAASWDLSYSISSALNALSMGIFGAYDTGPIPMDLSMAKPEYVTRWPPGMGALYLALLALGIEVPSATMCIAYACALLGGLGWARLMHYAGCGRAPIYLFSAFVPWLPFLSPNLQLLTTDLVVWAAAPWIDLLVLRFLAAHQLHRETGLFRAMRIGIICGSLVIMKYSTAPLLMAFGLFFLLESRGRPHRGFENCAFLAGLCLLPAAIFVINRAFGVPDEILLRGEIKSCDIALSDVTRILALPFRHFSGLVIMDEALPRGNILSLALPFISALCVGAALYRSATPQYRALLGLVTLQTAVSFAFFIVISASFVYCIRWDESMEHQYRYFSGIAGGWYYLAIGTLLTKNRWRSDIFKLAQTIILIVPLYIYVKNEMDFALELWRGPPMMTRHGTVWYSQYGDGMRFLEEQLARSSIRPDLIFAPSPELMAELEKPLYMVSNIQPWMHFWSMRPLTVWVLTWKDKPGSLKFADIRSAFSNASLVDRVTAPLRFPFELWVVKYNWRASPIEEPIDDALIRRREAILRQRRNRERGASAQKALRCGGDEARVDAVPAVICSPACRLSEAWGASNGLVDGPYTPAEGGGPAGRSGGKDADARGPQCGGQVRRAGIGAD